MLCKNLTWTWQHYEVFVAWPGEEGSRWGGIKTAALYIITDYDHMLHFEILVGHMKQESAIL